MQNEDFMNEAIREAYDGITNKHGGPFGSVVVKDGMIVGRGHNRVTVNQDPTCHGEMEAIRDAAKNLGTRDLSGCTLYTTAEPCPMCLGGILWANIDKVYYGCTTADVDAIGFRDSLFYDVLSGKNNILGKTQINTEQCKKLFENYKQTNDNRY